MKKLTSTLGVFAATAAIAAAFAMSPAPQKTAVKTSATDYYWFDLDGNYIEVDSQANKQDECGPQQRDCVLGASEIDENGNPDGTMIILQGNKEL